MPADRDALVWTREAPTCAGYWWHRSTSRLSDSREVTIVFIKPGCVPAHSFAYDEWSGPIPLPKEAT